MNKSELIIAFAETYGLSTDAAADVVNGFFNCLRQGLLEGDRVEIRGFGAFSIREYGSYSGRNPKTGEMVTVASKKLPFFKASNGLKEFLNG